MNRDLRVIADDEVAHLEGMAADLVALDETDSFIFEMPPTDEQVEEAKAIKRRRRKLGQNGYSPRRMAVPR